MLIEIQLHLNFIPCLSTINREATQILNYRNQHFKQKLGVRGNRLTEKYGMS